MSQLELKIPPAVVWVVAGLLMRLTRIVAPGLAWEVGQQGAVAWGFIAAGALIGALGVLSFRRARTTVNPLHPEAASTLVIAGIYRATRNPMYLGMLVALIGWAVWVGNFASWIFLPAFVAYMNRFQILPEERSLAAKFGADFAAYRSRVRRWL